MNTTDNDFGERTNVIGKKIIFLEKAVDIIKDRIAFVRQMSLDTAPLERILGYAEAELDGARREYLDELTAKLLINSDNPKKYLAGMLDEELGLGILRSFDSAYDIMNSVREYKSRKEYNKK